MGESWLSSVRWKRRYCVRDSEFAVLGLDCYNHRAFDLSCWAACFVVSVAQNNCVGRSALPGYETVVVAVRCCFLLLRFAGGALRSWVVEH